MSPLIARFLFFIVIVAALVSVYSVGIGGSGTSIANDNSIYNEVNNQLVTNQHNPQVNTNGANLNGASTNITTKTTTATTSTTSTQISKCVSFVPYWCNVVNFVDVAWTPLICYIYPQPNFECPPTGGQFPNGGGIVPNVLNGANPFSINTQYAGANNFWYKIFGSPVTQAISIAAIFLGLGWLAGTLGAGILANVMGRVGIGLGLIYWANANMATFGINMLGVLDPAQPLWIIDVFIAGIFTVPMIAMIWVSLGSGKES